MGFFALHIAASAALLLPNVLGYNLIFGKGKIFHFGPIGVSLISAYSIFITQEHTGSFALGILVAVLLAGALSVLLTILSLKMEPDGLGILTLAIHLGILAVVLNWASLTHGGIGIRIARPAFLQDNVTFTVIVIAIAALWILLLFLLNRSRYGRALSALAEHPLYAAALGIERWKIHLVAFLVGALGAITTNVFYHLYIYLLHPSDFSYALFVFFVAIILAGGPGSVLGCTLSAIGFVLLKEGLRFLNVPTSLEGSLQVFLFGIILLIALYLRRDRLFPVRRTV